MPARPRVAVTLTQCWHRVPGGSATSVLQLLGALERTGEVDLVGVLSRGDLRRPSSLLPGRRPPAPWTPPVPTGVVPLPLPVLYDAWRRTGRPSIERATGPVDLVHLTVPVPLASTAAPVVATVHDVFPLSDPERMTRRGADLTRAGLEWTRRHAAAVMVPSRTVRDECVRHGFDPGRLRVVAWGAEVGVPDAAAVDAVLARHGIERPYVLFAGTVEPRKNLPTLLAAITELDRPDLTLVLAGPDGWGGAIDDDLAGVPGPVARLGLVDRGDLAALQRGAAAFAFPSLAEGFGLPVLEAMAAGAAVVTSDRSATAEVAGEGAVLVDPHDVHALAAALGALVDAGDGAAELRERAVRRAGDFTWAEAADRTLATYREVLA